MVNLKDTFDKNIVLSSMLGCLFEVCETQLVSKVVTCVDLGGIFQGGQFV